MAPALAAAVERTAAALRRLGAEDGVGAREIAVTGYAVAAIRASPRRSA